MGRLCFSDDELVDEVPQTWVVEGELYLVEFHGAKAIESVKRLRHSTSSFSEAIRALLSSPKAPVSLTVVLNSFPCAYELYDLLLMRAIPSLGDNENTPPTTTVAKGGRRNSIGETVRKRL